MRLDRVSRGLHVLDDLLRQFETFDKDFDVFRVRDWSTTSRERRERDASDREDRYVRSKKSERGEEKLCSRKAGSQIGSSKTFLDLSETDPLDLGVTRTTMGWMVEGRTV